ncbi:MAG: hypothetical protein U1E23_00225 [Reyranellaceae bacterium]
MRRVLLALAATASLGFVAGTFATVPVQAQTAKFVPAPGAEVVVYTHQFKPEFFDQGLKLARDGFTAAQAAAGQTRRNDIIVDPGTYQVVLISYFASPADVDAWHKAVSRLDVLKQLEPMRSQPMKVQRFKFDSTTYAP